MSCNAGAEAVQSAEGNISGAVMRGSAALPGSETSSRTKGSRRNLGDLLSPVAAQAAPGRGGKLSRAKPPRKTGGVGRLRTTGEAPNKADHVGGGGCGGKAAGRGEGKLQRMLRTLSRTRHVTEAASLRAGCGGYSGPEPRSRLTCDRSPVRESRTPGSVGEVPGNRHLYPTLNGGAHATAVFAGPARARAAGA